MNTTYTHTLQLEQKNDKRKRKNIHAGNLSDISAITEKAAPTRDVFDVEHSARFYHSSLGNLKTK